MRIKKIELRNVKSFDGVVSAHFDEMTSMFAFSGMNGAGKSTFLKMAWLIQKAHFIKSTKKDELWISLQSEILRFLNHSNSYAEVLFSHSDKDASIRLERIGAKEDFNLIYSDEDFISELWNLKSPSNIILYVDASKGFSEDTLRFDEINIDDNEKSSLSLEAVFNPELLFSGIYRQLVKDYVHSRLIPSKPDRLLYYHVASKLFTKLIPNVELKNFSGNFKPKEFVLLGKANADQHKPLYDVREFSSGEKALLSTLTFLCISKSVSTLIIDEPENHFHESLLLEFISVLHKLSDKEGILSWISEADQKGKKINLEWVKTEYKEHNLSQVIVSTHSKPLIYKFFSIGRNFVVNKGVHEIVYENAESQLREIGLSTTYTKVILVEGSGDNEALENIFKGKNIKIKALHGSTAVIDTFKRLAGVRRYLQESNFVFLVDSDNKPDSFFTEVRNIDPAFYDSSFIKLEAHEFENLYLDPEIFKHVMDGYASVAGNTETQFSVEEIKKELTNFARSSLPQVYKKEISLTLQQGIEQHFANLIWGNKNFNWDTSSSVEMQLTQILTSSNLEILNSLLASNAKSVFDLYALADEVTLRKRCDGKQVLGKACSYFGNQVGVTSKKFKEAIYHAAASSINSDVSKLTAELLHRLERGL